MKRAMEATPASAPRRRAVSNLFKANSFGLRKIGKRSSHPLGVQATGLGEESRVASVVRTTQTVRVGAGRQVGRRELRKLRLPTPARQCRWRGGQSPRLRA